MIAQQMDRNTYIGSSDIAAILGISPWRTKLDVFLDKTQGRQPVTAAKQRIFDRGHRLEPYILDMYSEEAGETLIARNHRYIDSEFPFLAAEVDAETETGKNVEAKSTHQFAAKLWGEEMTDAIPVYYNAQSQYAMNINRAEVTEFPVLIGIDDFRIYRVERDEEIGGLMKEAAVKFWTDHIVTGIAPEPQTVSDLERLIPWDKGTIIQASDEIRDAVLDLKRLKSKIKTSEADADDLAARIKMFMGENSILNYGAATLLTWKSQKTVRHDGEMFKMKHPRIAAKFTKESISRVMRIK